MTLYTTYATWKQGVADWIDTTSGPVFNNTGTFIRLAELELDKRLRLRQSMRFATTTIDNDGILTLPSDYSQMKQALLPNDDGGRPLDPVTPDQFQNTRTRPLGSDGTPQYYTIIGNNLQFAPKGAGVDVEIAYYRRAEPLSEFVPENIYTKYAAEALLQAACMFGFKFAADEERMMGWQEKLNEQIIEINLDAERGELPASPLKMRTSMRMPVRRYR